MVDMGILVTVLAIEKRPSVRDVFVVSEGADMYVGSFVTYVLTVFGVFMFCCYVSYSVGTEEMDIVNMNFTYSRSV